MKLKIVFSVILALTSGAVNLIFHKDICILIQHVINQLKYNGNRIYPKFSDRQA